MVLVWHPPIYNPSIHQFSLLLYPLRVTGHTWLIFGGGGACGPPGHIKKKYKKNNGYLLFKTKLTTFKTSEQYNLLFKIRKILNNLWYNGFCGVSFVTKSSGIRDKFQLKREAQKLYFINPPDGKWPHYRHYYRYTDKQWYTWWVWWSCWV